MGSIRITLIEAIRRLRLAVKRSPDRSSPRSEAVVTSLDTAVHRQKIIDLASAQAKIGIWECDLATGRLAWTDGVYTLFELQPGSMVTRAQTIALYEPASRAEMETLRARAIREKTGFTLDARIRTAKGNDRWMRLTADVECENGVAVRLFGMKQDITQERMLLEQLRLLAETDPLTGLANLGRMRARLKAATEGEAIGALFLIDLDGFKAVNDTFGHAAGDECLSRTAERMRDVCNEDAFIARLGGDEFAIMTGAGMTQSALVTLADRLLAALRQPIAWKGRQFCISGSIGIALPRAHGASDLLVDADIALYAAKAAGRDRARIFGLDGECGTKANGLIASQLDLFGEPVALMAA